MAQLKDLIVNGATRLIGDAYVNNIQITNLIAPTSAGGSTYGPGTEGQVLLSNNGSVYWGSAAPTVTESTVSGWGFTKNTGTITGATNNGGLKVTGTTLGHSNTAITAQATQAIYPIKIDALGHITGYGTAIVSSTAANNGTTLSLVTTGEKYTWNNKSNLTIGTTSATAAAGNHTHTTSLATDNGTATITLAHNTTYKLTAGGTNVIFKTPTVPTAISSFTNDAGYITSVDVPEGASAYTGTISAVGTSASTGTNNGFARGDHVHNITKATIDNVLGTGSGTAKFYREDGTWQTPVDTKVTQTAISNLSDYTNWRPLLIGSNSNSSSTAELTTTTGSTYTASSILVKPSNGTIKATTFDGNATSASKLGSDTKGSTTKPIYLSSGAPAECSTYAGGTKVTLNNSDKGGSTASFYAPTTAGTANQILVSAGGTSAPTWKATANGAAYATSANGALTFGTLPVAQGGTGNTSQTASRMCYTNSSGNITSGYHYVDNTHVAIGSTTAPSTTFHVGGTASISSSLTLTGTTAATAHIAFSRTGSSSYNYITVPSDSNLAIGFDTNGDSTWYRMTSSAIFPAQGGTYDLGKINTRWKALYLRKFNIYTTSYGTTLPTSDMETGDIFFMYVD